MKVYLACGLTHVPRKQFGRYVSFIHTLAQRLKAGTDTEVRYALLHTDPQLAEKPIEQRARLCYVWDREIIEWADVLIADATYPSIGLGIELQIAENGAKPIVLCFEQSDEHRAPRADYDNPDGSHHTLQIGDGYVSILAQGLPNIFRVVGYQSVAEALSKVSATLALLKK